MNLDRLYAAVANMPTPYYDDEDGRIIYCGDCRELLPQLQPCVHAVVTDPPYGLEFMGKDWDKLGGTVEVANENMDKSHPFRDGTNRIRYGSSAASMQTWHQQWAELALAACLPGANLLAFGGTRTSHRLTCAIEDAGWQIRDTLMWLYGSG